MVQQFAQSADCAVRYVHTYESFIITMIEGCSPESDHKSVIARVGMYNVAVCSFSS